jgi:hypothetical protein
VLHKHHIPTNRFARMSCRVSPEHARDKSSEKCRHRKGGGDAAHEEQRRQGEYAFFRFGRDPGQQQPGSGGQSQRDAARVCQVDGSACNRTYADPRQNQATGEDRQQDPEFDESFGRGPWLQRVV